MEAVLERCAGLDIHRDTIHATILWGPVDQKPSKIHHVFQTTTEQIKKLAQWLAQYHVKDVVMESTGIYWKPIWNLMEDTFHLTLANAKMIKNMPGRKTLNRCQRCSRARCRKVLPETDCLPIPFRRWAFPFIYR